MHIFLFWTRLAESGFFFIFCTNHVNNPEDSCVIRSVITTGQHNAANKPRARRWTQHALPRNPRDVETKNNIDFFGTVRTSNPISAGKGTRESGVTGSPATMIKSVFEISKCANTDAPQLKLVKYDLKFMYLRYISTFQHREKPEDTKTDLKIPSCIDSEQTHNRA